MRTPILPLLALVTAPAATAGDVQVTLVGHVTQIVGQLPPAFFATVEGEDVELVVELFDGPRVLAPDRWAYALDRSSGFLRIGPTTAPVDAAGIGALELLDSPAFDEISLEVPIDSLAPTLVRFLLHDPTSGTLSTPDVTDLVGTDPRVVWPALSATVFTDAAGSFELYVAVQRMRVREGTCAAFGTSYCAAVPNSTGAQASTGACGSLVVADDRFRLGATGLPPYAFGFFLAGRQRGLVVGPGGSSGNLCLGGAVGRFDAPGEIRDAGPAGTFALDVDLAAVPTPAGAVAVQPGETWNFTAWYRDSAGGGATSNFSDGLEVVFR